MSEEGQSTTYLLLTVSDFLTVSLVVACNTMISVSVWLTASLLVITNPSTAFVVTRPSRSLLVKVHSAVEPLDSAEVKARLDKQLEKMKEKDRESKALTKEVCGTVLI